MTETAVGTRKLIVSTYVSLDGVIDMESGWHFQYFDDDAGAYATRLLEASDALVMGRDTYDVFAGSWPSVDNDFARRVNAIPKYVATTRDEPLEWHNSHAIEGPIPDAIRRLKAEPGQNILMYGTGVVARELMLHGLVDEHHIWIHPVIVGEGTRLFGEGFERSAFALIGTYTTGSGVVILSYRPS